MSLSQNNDRDDIDETVVGGELNHNQGGFVSPPAQTAPPTGGTHLTSLPPTYYPTAEEGYHLDWDIYDNPTHEV